MLPSIEFPEVVLLLDDALTNHQGKLRSTLGVLREDLQRVLRDRDLPSGGTSAKSYSERALSPLGTR